MVRQSKSSASAPAPSTPSSSSSSSSVPAPVVEAAAPVKKAATKKAKAPVTTEAPVVTEVAPVVTEVLTNELAPAATTSAVESALVARLSEFSAKLQQIGSLFASVKNDFKTLEKTVSREIKTAQKLNSKKRRNNGNRKPSGFIKPTRISDELAGFLGKTVGTEMARTEVSREINAYIQQNSLQDKANGRKIHPDAKLTQLLKLNSEDELTYFNLQRYMKHHFIKAEVEAVATA
jgi:chromatin remodeling complex protein RSC6